MLPLVVLGATGSIGRQTLEVAHNLDCEVAGLAAGHPSPALAEIASRHPGATVAVAKGSPDEVRRLSESLATRVLVGREAVAELASATGRIVVNGIVGMAGLEATLAGLEAGNRVALANKESMVVAGTLVTRAAARGGGELIPVDSEHSALFQCLRGETVDDVRRVILTASGGPFRGWDRSRMSEVTPSQALAHPTWDMGGRITIDSATLVNKGLEVIEAHHLFGLGFDRIDVVVHPRSIVHSAVEFVDGSLKAHLGHPDMRIPIQYALTYPRRAQGFGPAFDLAGVGLIFEEADRDSFPALDLAYEVGRRGGSGPATFNAADEVAVAAFLENRLPFLGIVDVLAKTVERLPPTPVESLAEVQAADRAARESASDLVDRYSR